MREKPRFAAQVENYNVELYRIPLAGSYSEQREILKFRPFPIIQRVWFRVDTLFRN